MAAIGNDAYSDLSNVFNSVPVATKRDRCLAAQLAIPHRSFVRLQATRKRQITRTLPADPLRRRPFLFWRTLHGKQEYEDSSALAGEAWVRDASAPR